MKQAASEFTDPRLAGLMRSTAKLVLPRSVDFLEPPQMVLTAPQPTTLDVLDEVLGGWLLEHYSRSVSTGATYCSCMAVYLPWCSRNGIDPLLITRPQASRFAGWLAVQPSPETRAVRSASRRAQILSSCASLLEYAVDAAVRPEWARNPFENVKRPVVDRTPRPTPRITVSHVNQLVLGARADHLLGGVLGKLLIAIPARMGLRPGDVCRLNVSGVDDDGFGGFQLAIPVKGGKTLLRWLPPDMASDLATWLRLRPEPEEQERPDPLGPDPLFVHPRRLERANPDDLLRLVRRSALVAGLPYAGSICTRWFRPFFNTLAKAQGATLEERKTGLGHASATTTERYDRTDWAREHDPAIRVSAAFDDYPAEARIAPLVDQQQWRPPAIQRGCDCTPVWPTLHVDLSPVGVDQTAVCEPSDEHEPGTQALRPYCRRCRVAYPGPFRVVRVLDDDPAQLLLEEARRGMTEAALYPGAVQRRDERRRRDGES